MQQLTRYAKVGNQYRLLTAVPETNVVPELPAGVYTIVMTLDGPFIEPIPSFEVPARLYGDIRSKTDRVINTWIDRGENTGVLAVGIKGSGKSLLGKNISATLAERYNIPTIVINRPLCGEDFNIFLSKITQPVMVFFDEFDKTYDQEEQHRLLTLFDGVYSSNKLFFFSINDFALVDPHMKSRPNRIYYKFDFIGLTQSFIKEYCNDRLIEPGKWLIDVLHYTASRPSVTFDQLQALVQEINRYGESPSVAAEYLNIQDDKVRVVAPSVTHNGRLVRDANIGGGYISELPIGEKVVSFSIAMDGDFEAGDAERLVFTQSDLIETDLEEKIFKYRVTTQSGEYEITYNFGAVTFLRPAAFGETPMSPQRYNAPALERSRDNPFDSFRGGGMS